MIICFDLETTWLDKYNDEIIEIAMVKFDEQTFKIIDTFSTLVNPWIEIPEIISNITNIFNEDVAHSPFLDDIKKEVLDFIWDATLLWHNVFFDTWFFIEKWINIKDNVIVDTFFLANFLKSTEPSLNLELLCKSYNIPFTWAHRAINDVHATIWLFQKLISSFNKLSKIKKDLLYFIFCNSDDKNIDFLRTLLFAQDFIDVSFSDFEKKLLKQLKKYKESQKIILDKKIDTKNINKIFQWLWGLEIRDNQEKMMKGVYDNLNTKWSLVIEAPTWLWKSFAYLLPSIIHSLNTQEKVFISTKTKTLQDQLFYKDLDFLNKNLNIEFNYTKLKWRKNYLSISWLFDEIYLKDYSYEKVWFLIKIILWLFKTEFWELDELNYFWKEFSFLRDINSELIFKKDKKNIYNEYEFLYKARQNLLNANIVVINHSLLFSDLKAKNSILWDIDNLVIDEAHNIEDSITDSLRKKINLNSLTDLFEKVESIMIKHNINRIDFTNKKEQLLSKLDLVFDYSFSYLNNKVTWDNYYKNCLLNEDFYDNSNFWTLFTKIQLDFLWIIDYLSTIWEYNFSTEIVFMQDYFDTLKIIIDNKVDNKFIKIIWFNQKIWITLEYTLLNPWEYLSGNLYDKVNSILLTSATLKIWNSFLYFKKILSLDDFNFVSFDSDFDYKKQSTLFIPNDLWSIKYNSGVIINFLNNFYKIVWWKTLTLLTSFNIIRKIYTSTNQNLKQSWINLYAQSIWWSKIKLLEFFLDSPSNSILLGTDSFWEWVDIPWDSLKYLVIHKFPFWVPTDPIFQSRSKFYSDPFLDYAIPKAIIKLKQWFWRLIRSHSDSWMIILLDDRIYNTKWWKEFYKAFPSEINIKHWSSESLLSILKNKKQ